MERPFLQARFYETYSFANAVRNILYEQFEYLRYLDEFYGDYNFLAYTRPFPRYSAFHCFLEFVVSSLITDDARKVDLAERNELIENFKGIPAALKDMKPDVLPVEEALRFHNIKHTSFVSWLAEQGKTFKSADENDVDEYVSELTEGPLDELIRQSVKEVFYILFNNRSVLMLFNEMMAAQVSRHEIGECYDGEYEEDYKIYFKKNGVLNRHPIPVWVQRAVFFRDRGICVACRRDLTGLLNIWTQDHFDHIVPLDSGGLNDVTNIQLLCSTCNLKKGSRHIITSEFYEDWYPLDE